MSGLTNANAQALQASDVGFGIQNLRLLGGAGQTCNQSTHIIRSPFNNDPAIDCNRRQLTAACLTHRRLAIYQVRQ